PDIIAKSLLESCSCQGYQDETNNKEHCCPVIAVDNARSQHQCYHLAKVRILSCEDFAGPLILWSIPRDFFDKQPRDYYKLFGIRQLEITYFCAKVIFA